MRAQLCEVAWKQGVDLYGSEDNRLLAGRRIRRPMGPVATGAVQVLRQ